MSVKLIPVVSLPAALSGQSGLAAYLVLGGLACAVGLYVLVQVFRDLGRGAETAPEGARVLGRHPDGLWSAVPRHVKVMGWAAPLWLILALLATRLATGIGLSSALVALPLLSLAVPALLWVVWGVWDGARNRGAGVPVVWALAAVPALVLSPIGLIIFAVVYSVRLAGSTGWCSNCRNRVRQSLSTCPHCGSDFSDGGASQQAEASDTNQPPPVPVEQPDPAQEAPEVAQQTPAASSSPVEAGGKAITGWDELRTTMDALTGGAARDSAGRTIEDIRHSYMLQALYLGLIQHEDGYFDGVPFVDVTEDLVLKARAFQAPVQLPGALSYLGAQYNPEYVPVAAGDSYSLSRAGDPSFDTLVNSVSECLRDHPLKYTDASPSDLTLDAVKHYSRLPAVRFFASLPYLYDHLPERGERFILADYECSLLRCVDGILFQLYDELEEGGLIDDAFISSKVRAYLTAAH